MSVKHQCILVAIVNEISLSPKRLFAECSAHTELAGTEISSLLVWMRLNWKRSQLTTFPSLTQIRSLPGLSLTLMLNILESLSRTQFPCLKVQISLGLRWVWRLLYPYADLWECIIQKVTKWGCLYATYSQILSYNNIFKSILWCVFVKCHVMWFGLIIQILVALFLCKSYFSNWFQEARLMDDSLETIVLLSEMQVGGHSWHFKN